MSARKDTLLVKMQKFATGLQTYGKQKTFVLNGKPVKCDALLQTTQAQIVLLQQVVTAREDYQRAVAAAKPVASSFDVTFAQVRGFAEAQFGAGSQTCLAFGFAPRKPYQRGIVSSAKGLQQSLATRKARNTMGRKQKLAIRGVVPAASPQPASTQPATVAPVMQANGTTSSSSSPNGTGTQSH